MFPAIPDSAIALRADAADWRAAVGIAGDALTASGATSSAYSDEMIRMIEEHGPYVVIAPGLALAHARPGPAVLRDGLAVVTLAIPVAFGSAHNDPVSVVLGLAASSSERQLPLLADLANVFNDSDAIRRLADASSPDRVREILGVAA